MSFFCSRTVLYLVIMSPQGSSRFSQTLFLITLTVLRTSGLSQNAPYSNLFDVFHVIIGVMGFLKKDCRDKVPFPSHHIRVRVFVRFLHCEVTLYFPFTVTQEGSHYAQSTPKEWRVLFTFLEAEFLYLRKLFGILLRERFISFLSSVHSLIQSVSSAEAVPALAMEAMKLFLLAFVFL